MISIVTWKSNNNVWQILSYFCKASQYIYGRDGIPPDSELTLNVGLAYVNISKLLFTVSSSVHDEIGARAKKLLRVYLKKIVYA